MLAPQGYDPCIVGLDITVLIGCTPWCAARPWSFWTCCLTLQVIQVLTGPGDRYHGVLDISFVALSRNGFWFINLWLIFGHSGEKPRYGKNSRLLQDFPTGPRHVQLAWGSLGTGPRPKPLQRHVDILRAGGNEPHGTSGGQEQAKGIGAHNRLALATVVLGYPIIGMAVTDSNVYGPAIFIGLQHGVGRPRHRGTEKGFKGLETPKRLAAVGRGRAVKVRPPDHHDP